MNSKVQHSISLILTFFALTSCADSTSLKSDCDVSSNDVEVVFLHGNMRCKSCVLMERYAQEVVSQLGDDGIVWKEFDLTTRDGEEIGDKYEIVGSGLVVVKGTNWENLTETGYRYAYREPAKFKKILKEKILQFKE